jgi:hypothetical protein
MVFADVSLVTLAEGEITELHVGLKGTMNALFLKDLAQKTRRGLRGRVEAGRSGGGNAYAMTSSAPCARTVPSTPESGASTARRRTSYSASSGSTAWGSPRERSPRS